MVMVLALLLLALAIIEFARSELRRGPPRTWPARLGKRVRGWLSRFAGVVTGKPGKPHDR